jgi:hypothetical protein
MKEKLPLIQVLLVLDADNSLYPFDVREFATKKEPSNDRTTNAEVRRCYKLCTFENPAIQHIARETFKCVRLVKMGGGFLAAHYIKPIPAPWDYPEWAALWAARKTRSHSLTKGEFCWRKQLNMRIAEFEASLLPPPPQPPKKKCAKCQGCCSRFVSTLKRLLGCG